MNKKVKIAALFTALTLSVTAFAACGKKDDDGGKTSSVSENWSNADFESVFVSNYSAEKVTALTSSELSDFVGYDMESFGDGGSDNANVIVRFKKENAETGGYSYALYNTVLNKTVLTAETDNVKSVSFYSVNYGSAITGISYFESNSETGTGSRRYYSLDGKLFGEGMPSGIGRYTKVDEATGESHSFIKLSVTNDGVVAYYEFNVSTGETTPYGEKTETVGNEFKKFEVKYSFEGKAYDYLYGSNEIFVYEKGTATPIKSIDFGAFYDNIQIHVLGNETFLVQTFVKTTDAYDYIDFSSSTPEKYVLKSYIYNPADGSKTEVNLNYVCGSVNNALNTEEYSNVYKSGAENVATVQRISDKKLVNKARTVVLGNNLEVKGVLDNYVPEQDGLPQLASDGTFTVKTRHSDIYYIDKTGKVFAKEPNRADYVYNDFMRIGNTIYSLNTAKPIYNLNQDGVYDNIVTWNFCGNAVIRKTDKNTYAVSFDLLTAHGAVKSFLTVENYYDCGVLYTDSSVFYVISNDDRGFYVCNAYNAAGELLYAHESDYSEASDDYIFAGDRKIRIVTTAKIDENKQSVAHYYRLTEKTV